MLSGGRARDAPFAAQLLLARMVLCSLHELQQKGKIEMAKQNLGVVLRCDEQGLHRGQCTYISDEDPEKSCGPVATGGQF